MTSRRNAIEVTRGRHTLIIVIGVLCLPLLVALGLVTLVLWLPALLVVHLLVWSLWLPKGCLGVMVYSNSPNWQEDVEQTILPAVREKLVILNWSERRQWRNELAVWCFRLVNLGGRRNFNPMAIVFRPLRPLKTVRMFQAYREAKDGNMRELEAKKCELLKLIQ